MQANPAEQSVLDPSPIVFGVTSGLIEGQVLDDQGQQDGHPIGFHGAFASCMVMNATPQVVSDYLSAHRDWFPRCAQPMKAYPLGENGYDLTVGRFGAFGYDVEAKLGLDLLPQDEQGYRIQTIPIPGYQAPGYEVDFQAVLHLLEATDERTGQPLTHVDWELDLKVTVRFPRFIYAMPRTMIQTTGDRLLNQIVRQVSRCLTHKVQEDFHRELGVKMPKKRRSPWTKAKE